MTTLINIAGKDRDDPSNFSEDYVYIGRGSIWGNPFIIGRHGARDEVIELYRQYLWKSPKLIALLKKGALHCKTLGCFCTPQRCHGHVLIRAQNYYLEIGQHPRVKPTDTVLMRKGHPNPDSYSSTI